MKNIILILFTVFFASCQNGNEDDSISDNNKLNNIEIEQKLQSSFPPTHSPIAKILHTKGWERAYDFYENKIISYKNESYYQVGKIFIMGKVLGNDSFRQNPDAKVLNTFLNDIFKESLPTPAMVVRIIQIVEDNPNSNLVDLKKLLSENKKELIQMKNNLQNIRKTEYSPQLENSNLSVPNFEDKVSKYVKLN